MLDLLPLSEETKEDFLTVLRRVVTELAQHEDLYSDTFRTYFTDLGKLLNNSEGLDSEQLEESLIRLMAVLSEYQLNQELRYELVEDDIELE